MPCHAGAGAVVWKAAPTFPVRGPGLFAKAAQPALLTITVWVCAAFQECLSLLSLAQNSPTGVGKWWERLQNNAERAG